MALPKSAKCEKCPKPATVWILWAEGKGVIAACETHKEAIADSKRNGDDFVGFRPMGWHSEDKKSITEFSPRMMTALSFLSGHLLDPGVESKSLPTVNADGELIDSLKSLSVAMGVDEQTAAVYVLGTKDHSLSGVADSQFQPDYFGSASIDNYVAKIIRSKPEEKRIRLVRSVLGARRFSQPRGTIIVTDGQKPLANIHALPNDVAGYDKIGDFVGNYYYIGEERGRWVVRSPGVKEPVHVAASDREAYYWLDGVVPKKGKGKANARKQS